MISRSLAVKILLVAILALVMITAIYQLQGRATQAAYTEVANRIRNKAVYYKKHWLLEGEPKRLNLDGKMVYFGRDGWPLPINNAEFDCRYWIGLLYEEDRLFGNALEEVQRSRTTHDYTCSYSYKDQGQGTVVIKIVSGQFFVTNITKNK